MELPDTSMRGGKKRRFFCTCIYKPRRTKKDLDNNICKMWVWMQMKLDIIYNHKDIPSLPMSHSLTVPFLLYAMSMMLVLSPFHLSLAAMDETTSPPFFPFKGLLILGSNPNLSSLLFSSLSSFRSLSSSSIASQPSYSALLINPVAGT